MNSQLKNFKLSNLEWFYAGYLVLVPCSWFLVRYLALLPWFWLRVAGCGLRVAGSGFRVCFTRHAAFNENDAAHIG
jgi:4-amino-4-deoxy-L-arabinose transferase-like glycosyltransferase